MADVHFPIYTEEKVGIVFCLFKVSLADMLIANINSY